MPQAQKLYHAFDYRRRYHCNNREWPTGQTTAAAETNEQMCSPENDKPSSSVPVKKKKKKKITGNKNGRFSLLLFVEKQKEIKTKK